MEADLDGLEPLGDRPQAPGEAVDVVAGRQVQIADRLGAGLLGSLARPERDLERLVRPWVVDQELGEFAQCALPSGGEAVPDLIAAALVHIVHRHGTATNSGPLRSMDTHASRILPTVSVNYEPRVRDALWATVPVAKPYANQ